MKICRTCKQEKDVKSFYILRHNKNGKICTSLDCKKCFGSKISNKYHKNKIFKKEENNLIAKRSRLKLIYKITIEDYDILFKNQNGKCAICGKYQSELKKELNVDHCHITGKVRGLLCLDCNHGLGKFFDNSEILQNAVDYINLLKNNQNQL